MSSTGDRVCFPGGEFECNPENGLPNLVAALGIFLCATAIFAASDFLHSLQNNLD